MPNIEQMILKHDLKSTRILYDIESVRPAEGQKYHFLIDVTYDDDSDVIHEHPKSLYDGKFSSTKI